MAMLARYFWRLLPGNPILLRVVETGSRRVRDLLARCAYLGLLIVIVVVSLMGAADARTGADLAQLNVVSQKIFTTLSYLQLGLVAMLAPMFTAGAITQEKDAQTYDILLATPLSNAQIVLGSLASRLFFVFTLLLSGLPVFSITQIFGGVALGDIVTSALIAAATATVTGALAIAIATFKVGTRRTIFSFYLVNAIYLVGVGLLDRWSALAVPLVDGSRSAISYLTPLHPFLALRTVLDPTGYSAPGLTELPEHLRVWPIGFALTRPAAAFVVLQLVLSLLLVMPSILFMRRIAQSSTTIGQWFLKRLPWTRKGNDRPARAVWNNPIAWREAKTKASASRATWMRTLAVLGGVVVAILLLVGFSRDAKPPASYVEFGSYTASAETLSVRGAREAVYRVTESTEVLRPRTGDNEPERISLSELNSRWEIVGPLAIRTVGGVQVLDRITVQPVARQIEPATLRMLVLGLILLEVAVVLVTITMSAASTVTREKEDGTLDLLLATPITSRYYLWGKLRGLVAGVAPLVALPCATAMVFVIYDAFRWTFGNDPRFEWIVLPEAIVVLPATVLILAGLAGIVGMQMSLRLRTTTWAVIASMAILFGTLGTLGWCGTQIASSGGNVVSVALASLSPGTSILLMISPGEFVTDRFGEAAFGPGERWSAGIFSLASVALYAGAIYLMYRAMVKNFDMTIRKQSR